MFSPFLCILFFNCLANQQDIHQPIPSSISMHPPPSSSSPAATAAVSYASFPMVAIAIIGILATLILLASYYAFVTNCQVLHTLLSSRSWRRRHREASITRTAAATEAQGLGLPIIHMLPIIKFTATDVERCDIASRRISVSECAVCLSEFQEQERVRLLPSCSHAFHIDCIDTWLQGNTKCPFCRSDITLPLAHPTSHGSCREHQELGDSIVMDVTALQETWSSHRHAPTTRVRHKVESMGDEAIDTRKKDEQFGVQPMRRSLSMDSSCEKQLYLSVQGVVRERQDVALDSDCDSRRRELGEGSGRWCFKFRQV